MTAPIGYFADTKSWELLSGGAGSLDDIYGRLAVDNTWEGYQYFNGNAEVNGGAGSYLWVHTGGAAGGCEIDVEAIPGSVAKLAFFTGPGSSLRWAISKNDTAESGGNVGSDLDIDAYNGGATYIGTALSIKRSTMAATFGRSILTAGVTGGDKGAGTINATALYEAGSALTAKYGQLAVANTFTAQQTISLSSVSAIPLVLVSTEAAAAAGPQLNLFRDSISPAAADNTGALRFDGRTSAATQTTYAQLLATIIDPLDSARKGKLTIYAMATTLQPVMTFGPGVAVGTAVDQGANTFNAQTIYENATLLTAKYGQLAVGNTWSGAQVIQTNVAALLALVNTLDTLPGAQLFLRHTRATPAANDIAGTVYFQGNNAAPTLVNFGTLSVTAQDVVAGSEDTRFEFATYVAGTFNNRVYIGGGLSTQGASDMGAGTMNTTTLYEAGVSLATKYGALASANTWTANQTISLANPDLILNKAASTNIAVIDFQTATSLRWRIGSNATAEGGANAGSDFDILARTDAGGVLSTPISIARSTGIVTLSAVPVAAGYPVQTGGYNVRSSDADVTLTVRSASGTYEKFTAGLTAARAVVLSTTGAVAGDRFYITRTGSGAFNLNVGTGPLKALIQNTWCIVVYDGTAWYLAAYGAL